MCNLACLPSTAQATHRPLLHRDINSRIDCVAFSFIISPIPSESPGPRPLAQMPTSSPLHWFLPYPTRSPYQSRQSSNHRPCRGTQPPRQTSGTDTPCSRCLKLCLSSIPHPRHYTLVPAHPSAAPAEPYHFRGSFASASMLPIHPGDTHPALRSASSLRGPYRRPGWPCPHHHPHHHYPTGHISSLTIHGSRSVSSLHAPDAHPWPEVPRRLSHPSRPPNIDDSPRLQSPLPLASDE